MFTESEKTSTELGLIIAMVCSIIFSATVFFIFGCVCGQAWQKHKQSIETSQSDIKEANSHNSSAPDHTIIPAELEMMENVAYGPLKCTANK
jgi:hypothetical protein